MTQEVNKKKVWKSIQMAKLEMKDLTKSCDNTELKNTINNAIKNLQEANAELAKWNRL